MSKLNGIWQTPAFGPRVPQPNLALEFDDTLEWGQGGPTVAKAKAYGDRGDLLSLITLMRSPIEISDGEGLLHWYGILHDAVIHLGNRTYTISLDSLSNSVAVAFSAPGQGQTGQTTRGTTAWSEDSDSVTLYGRKQHLEPAADRSIDEAETVRDQILKDRKKPGAIPEDGDGSFYAELLFRGLFDTLDWIFYAQSNGITGYTTSEITLFKFGRSGYPDKIAMSFEVSANGGIKSALLPVARVGSPPGNLRVSIYSDAGGPNVEIESVDVTATDLTTHPEQGYEFPLPNTGAYTAGTTYWMVVTPSVIGGAGDPYFMIQVSTELGYPDGSFLKYESGVWGAASPDVDMLFTVVESWDGLTRLADIVTDCGQFLTGVDNRVSGGLSGNTSCPYQDGDRTGKPLIEEILQAGRSGNQPFYALVTPERELRIEEEAASTTEPVLQIDEAGYIFNRYGVPIECCQDALFKWAVLLGVADDLEQYDQYVSSNGRVFITAVEMDCATGVVRALETKAPQPAALSPASSPREVAASIKPMVLQWMDQRGGMTHAVDYSTGIGGWGLTGNAGTNPAINFLGTIDNLDLVFRTNNVERVRIKSDAACVGIGVAPDAGYSLDTLAGIHTQSGDIIATGGLQAESGNIIASAGAITADVGNITAGNDLTSSNGNIYALAGFVQAQTSLKGNESGTDNDSYIKGLTDDNLFYVDASADKVGIGVAAPTSKLDVAGDVEITSNLYYYIGDPSTNGSWRIGQGAGTDLLFQRRDAGVWTTHDVGGGHDEVTLSVAADTLLSLTGQEIGLDTQAKNLICAGPALGADAAPTFRSLVSDDIPDLSGIYMTPAAHTAIGDGAPHHAAVTLAASADVLLGLSTQQLSLDTQSANTGLFGPTTGAAAAPTFRSLVSADIPNPLFLGDTSNANMTLGLTINQGANTDEILAFKASSVAHGMTDIAETDTFSAYRLVSATAGGLVLDGLSETTLGLLLRGLGVTDNTTKTTAATGYVEIRAAKKSGTGIGAVGAAANILVIRDNATAIWLVEQSGTQRIAGGLMVGALGTAPTAGDVWCSGLISTDSGTTKWDLGGYTASAPAATGYVTVTINGTAYKFLAAT